MPGPINLVAATRSITMVAGVLQQQINGSRANFATKWHKAYPFGSVQEGKKYYRSICVVIAEPHAHALNRSCFPGSDFETRSPELLQDKLLHLESLEIATWHGSKEEEMPQASRSSYQRSCGTRLLHRTSHSGQCQTALSTMFRRNSSRVPQPTAFTASESTTKWVWFQEEPWN